MSERKWVSKMGPLKKGALHRSLGVPEGKRIPLSKLMKASHVGGKTGARARLAMAFRTMRHKQVPRQYELIRDSYARPDGPLRSIKSPVARLKKAKEIAAKTWNKRHPNDPNPWNREAK